MVHARRFTLTALCVAALLVEAAAGCSRGGGKKGPAVARGNDITVTSEEFKARLDEQSPFVRARYGTLERKKEFLENLIRFELLAAEARRQNLDKDPEVQATLKRIMVQKLVRQAFDEKGAGRATESDARQYYDDHKEEFVKPERLRISQIFLKAEKGSPDRARRSAEARKLYARLKASEPKAPLAFANLARDASDDHASKAAGGDLGYRSRDELQKLWGSEVASAAFALKDMGQESSVVESDHGFHLLKLASRQPAMNRSFDEVKAQLVARIGREKRTKDFDAYVKKLRDGAHVEIDDAELQKIAVSAGPAPIGVSAPLSSGSPGGAQRGISAPRPAQR
jgi:peptidyl-prolyl cis-trans isomerase C